MDSTKTVPAFYEPVVPQIVPQLLSQTNILLHAHQIPSLVAHEELNTDSRSSGVVRSHRSTPSRSQGPYAKSVAFREASRTPRSPTPPITIRSTIRKHAMPESRDVTPQPEEDEESDSDVSHTSSVHSQLSDDFKIPKPIGEVGRPGSGGYSLNAELGLHPKSFKELKVFCVFCTLSTFSLSNVVRRNMSINSSACTSTSRPATPDRTSSRYEGWLKL
jgi:hypothetical protein